MSGSGIKVPGSGEELERAVKTLASHPHPRFRDPLAESASEAASYDLLRRDRNNPRFESKGVRRRLLMGVEAESLRTPSVAIDCRGHSLGFNHHQAEMVLEMLDSRENHVVRLDWVPSPNLEEVRDCLARYMPKAVIVEGREFRRFMGIYEDVRSVLAHRSRKTRAKLRQFENKMNRDRGLVEIGRFDQVEEVEDFTQIAMEIKAGSYHGRNDIGISNDPAWIEWLRFFAQRSMLRGRVLTVDGTPAAYLMLVSDGVSCGAEALGIDRRLDLESAGTILLKRTVEELVGDGIRAIDFGVGESHYKMLFSNVSVAYRSLHAYPGGHLIPRLSHQAIERISSSTQRLSMTKAGRWLRRRAVNK